MEFTLKDRLYLQVPFEKKDIVKEKGAKFDGEKKKWYLTADLDPLSFRRYWGFLECPYKDKDLAKSKGAKFDRLLKKWYVPSTRDFDDFSEWWPEQLQQFIVDKKYSIYERIEVSGQASVYRAYDVNSSEEVAIKFFQRDDGNPLTKEAFSREMRAVEALQGQAEILPCLAWGQHTPSKKMFLVMPYIKFNLKEWFPQTTEEQETLASKITAELANIYYDEDSDDEIQELYDDTLKAIRNNNEIDIKEASFIAM